MTTIDEIEALLARATPGPWVQTEWMVDASGLGRELASFELDEPVDIDNAKLIVALRNAAPDLIAVVRAAAKLRHHDEGSSVCGTYYRPPRACDCKNGELVEALAKLGVGP